MKYPASLFAFFVATALLGPLSSVEAQTASGTAASGTAASGASEQWVVPRTADGHPDLQGDWTNVTLTPIQRISGQGLILTPEEVIRIEQGQADDVIATTRASDPDRAPPPAGGTDPVCIDGPRTCYNSVYIDPGERVAVVNGEPRGSLITFPSDGLVPALTPEAQQRAEEYQAFRSGFGPYDHVELRPLSERCFAWTVSSGPPMFPNGWYNNNYTIVQTADYVMIMAEMVHDARIIRIGAGPRLPDHIRPWMGDSWGYWEGDVLVVETTNFHPMQYLPGQWDETYLSSDNLKVIERFSRIDQETILYEFEVDDPTTYTEPWGGEIPMKALKNSQLYEYACHEGNYSMAGILSGARYRERVEAQNQDELR